MDMLKTSLPEDLAPALQLLKQYLYEQYQERLSNVILFGSYARQEASADSDVDVLIVLRDPVDVSVEINKTGQFVSQLCLDYNLLISRFFLSKSRYETKNSPLLRNVRKEGIVV